MRDRPIEGHRFLHVCELRGIEVRDLMAFRRHHLSGTPYSLESAIDLVVELAIEAYMHETDQYDPDLMDNRVDTDVVTYLTEDDESECGDGDIDNRVYNRYIDQSIRAIDQLFELIGPSIIEEMEDTYDYSLEDDRLWIDVDGTHLSGRNTLSFCVEFVGQAEY